MQRITLVVPCYNEARRLDGPAWQGFLQQAPAFDLLFVNDGSRDGTLELLHDLQRSGPTRIEVLNLPENCGKAEAVRRGVLRAVERGCRYVGFWDADLATPLDEAPRMAEVLDRLPDLQLVLGARMPLLGRRIERRPLRRWLGRAFSTAAGMVVGARCLDTQCGAKLFRVTPITRLAFRDVFVSRWIFDVELLVRIGLAARARSRADLGRLFYELPLDQWREVAGSHLKGRDFLRAAAELLRIADWRRRRRGPGQYAVEIESPAVFRLARPAALAEASGPGSRPTSSDPEMAPTGQRRAG